VQWSQQVLVQSKTLRNQVRNLRPGDSFLCLLDDPTLTLGFFFFNVSVAKVRVGNRSFERIDDFFKMTCGALACTEVGLDDGNEICAADAVLVAQNLPEPFVSRILVATVILSSLRRLIEGAGNGVAFLVDESARRRRCGILSFVGKLRCLDGWPPMSSSRSSQLGRSACIVEVPGLGGSAMKGEGLGIFRQGC
jgi:hypothetical protein